MSLLSMPFLIVNFGGEMIYILEQRLHAQNIAAEKANKVLQDVTKAMFNEKFVAELLKPQPLYSSSATREIFDRLAHSSIMRLSESSMDKLYDLMTMGFKYQLVSCTHPRELCEVTLNHLESIRQAVDTPSGKAVVDSVDSATAHIVKLCKEISTAEFHQIRQSLATFLQDKRIKVSLFLQDGIQGADGVIVLPKAAPLPADGSVEAPGTIKADGATDKFAYPSAGNVGPRSTADQFDPASRDCKLGRNLYTIDRSAKKAAAGAKPAAKPAAAATATSAQAVKGSAVSKEMGALANLIGVGKAPETFTMKLFAGDGEGDSAAAGGGSREIVISQVSREELLKTNQELVDIVGSMNDTEGDS